MQGPVTSSENIQSKRAIPALAIIQGIAAISGMMIKGVNALVDAKRASSFNSAIKLVNENVQITHDRLITLENRTAMMAKAIIPVLKNFKEKINNTNERLMAQYRMMTRAHDRYNTLFRQTHKTFTIHHLALLMFKDYITILVSTLQRIHRQYIRYESALDDTLIRRQCLMYSTRVCSLVNLRGGWVGRGGNPPHLPPHHHPPTYPPTPPPTTPTPTPPPTPPTHPQLASSSTDTFKQRENQNKEKLTKVAAYEL